MRWIVLGLVACAALAAPTKAATLTGRVTDAKGQPVSDVSVAVTELRRGDLTDSDGRYAIASIPLGTYHVSFQRLGFAPRVEHVTFADPPVPLDVTLVESLVEIPGAQVSATPRATSTLESPQPTTTLSGDALRQNAAPTLGATLEKVPGLRNWSTGAGVGKPSIRGLRSDRVLMTMDGQRLDNQSWGDEHGPQIEVGDAERIEVIRGPASVLYGSDALGGVVNVLPRDLPSAFGEPSFVHGRAYGAFGSVNQNVEGGLGFEGAKEGFGWRVSGTARGSDVIDTPEGPLFNSGNESQTVSGAAGLRGGWGGVDASYTQRHERVEFHEDPAEDPTATPYQKIRDDLARASLLLPTSSRSHLEVRAGYERNRRSEFEADDDPDVALGLLATTHNVDARFHHPPFGAAEGLLGVSLAREAFEKFGEESLVPGSDGLDLAAYLYEQIDEGRWHFSAGARFDHRTLDVDQDDDLGVSAQERDWSALSGNVGALYRLSEPTALVLNVARGFRAPSNYDLFANGVHEGTVSFEVGDSTLDVERSLSVDLAARLQSTRVHAEVSVFVNSIADYIYTRPTGTFDPGSGFEIFQAVQGDARLVGFEASGEVHPSETLHMSASVDHVRGDNTTTDTPLPWIAPLRGRVGARVEPASSAHARDPYLGLEVESVARQTRLDPNDFAVSPYTLVHAEAGVALPLGDRLLQIDVAARNLFDRAYRDFMSRMKAFALAPGRNVTARVSFRF